MNSVRITILFGAVGGLLQLGCADVGSASDGTPTPPMSSTRALTATETPGIDITGTWFTKVSTPGSIKAAISDNVTIDAWIRNYVSPAGDVTFNICRLATTGGVILANSYSQALIATLQATEPRSGGTLFRIGDAISFPTFTVYSGRDAAGNSVDAIPPPFPAGDGDRHPGVTIPTTVAGLFKFNIYAGLVITVSMSGLRLVDAATVAGDTSFSSHGVIFHSTNELLARPNMTIDVTTKAASVPFTATKLDSDGSTTCADIAKLP